MWHPFRSLAFVLGLTCLVMNGCDRAPRSASAAPPASPLTTLRIDGSTTLNPVFIELAERYRAAHPTIAIDLKQGGSTTGVNRLLAGEINLALVSRDLKQSEVDSGATAGKNLRGFLIGYDAIGVIMHPDRCKVVGHLNREQVRKIFFDGTISDWSQLDQSLSGPINVYTRDAKVSGTAVAFNELVAGAELAPYVTRTKVVDETPHIVDAVATDPNGIAFAPFAFLDSRVGAVDYGNTDAELVPCTLPAVRSDRYRLKRHLNIVATSPVSPVASDFIDFVMSEQGQALVAKHKFAPIR